MKRKKPLNSGKNCSIMQIMMELFAVRSKT